MGEQLYYIRVCGNVRGPFTLGQLERLRQRGQFRSFHEVSPDQHTWRPAATLEEVFPRRGPAGRRQEADPGDEVNVVPVDAHPERWFHLNAAGHSTGPLSREELVARFREGAVAPTTLVWKEGTPSWVPWAESELGAAEGPRPAEDPPAGHTRRRALGLAAALLAVLAAAGALLAWQLLRASPAAMRLLGSKQIAGFADERALAQALGLVVCGAKVTAPDGTLFDAVIITGTGFAITPDGYLLTNKHVVEPVWKLKHADLRLNELREKRQLVVKPVVWVFFGKEPFEAEFVHVSDDYDLCVLKVNRSDAPYFRLAGADDLSRGRKVVALGFPGAAREPLSVEELFADAARQRLASTVKNQFKARDFEFVMTDGMIGRVTAEEGSGRRWIQHNASINRGNSGGPLLVEDGTVVGINTLSLANEKVQGIFYSLATPQLRQEIERHVRHAGWQ